MPDFDDIRPYNDDEVRPILDRLIADREFIRAIASLKFPRAGKLVATLFGSSIQKKLKKEVLGVNSVADLQSLIEGYMKATFDRTVTNLTVSGLENLERDCAHLFISNHRDIAMDPAFVNWTLYKNGFTTLRIAIGDNLLTKPFASDLMRLNKCFIVNRSATSPREKLKAAKHLSNYIRHSVIHDNENVWIAQREGRAKDGLDETNPAIVSMLALSRPKTISLSEHIRESRIVPVSISYEYDPCDQAKAKELYQIAVDGEYTKDEHEDVQSIAAGITGYKGNVHLSFGKPITKNFEDLDSVVTDLNSQIKANYVLHPSNCFAYEMLEKSSPVVDVGVSGEKFSELDLSEQRRLFKERISTCPTQYQETLLKGYANPVYMKLQLSGTAC